MRAILTSLLGMVLCCGPIGCGAQVTPDEALAIAAIERLGGKIKRDELRAGHPVVEVGLAGTSATDGDLERLASFQELESLALYDSAIGDGGLAHLRRFAKLRTLYLGRTQVTDDGLANLGGLMQLKTLGLTDTRISDAGLAHLKGLTNLKSVNLHGARATPQGIRQLQQALPGIVVHQ